MSLQTLENGTIAEMWKSALAEFEQLVPDKGFKNLAVSTTPEELRKKIETLNTEAEARKSPNASRVKDVGLKVVEVIKTFGGVAAETVGMVFGPAQVCYGALSIFLSIPGKVREFHEFIELVFIELDPVLSQFDIYIKMEKDHSIHENLQTAIHKVMASFVHLCGTVINVQQGGKWERFKRHTKNILADDKELQEELEKFKRIVSGLQGIQVTATYEGVVETRAGVIEVQRSVDGVGSNVKKLVDEQDKRAKDDKKKESLEEIRKALNIKEEDANNPKKRQEKMLSARLQGTGNWLLRDGKFKKWADSHGTDSDSILYLTGPSGFGKSTLLSVIIHQLRSQASALRQERRSLISFHFLPTQKDKGLDQDNLAETALKWVAVQLAEQDDLLCKNMAAAVNSRTEELRSASVTGLWDLLKLRSASARTTNYLVFDDVDKFTKPAQQQLAKILAEVSAGSDGQSSIKILVAGENLDTGIFGPEAEEGERNIKVNVETMREDFERYINEKLRQKTMLPGPGCAELRLKLKNKLLETGECSFRTIDIAMKNIERVIASSGKEADLFQAIDRSTQDEDDVMKETLSQLQSELFPAQIDLINDILVWVVYGYDEQWAYQFYLPTLELALRTTGVELPIEGLTNFISSKAQGLMHITEENVVLEDGAKKAVVKPRSVPRLAEPPRISLEIKVVNADLPTARRFFWDLAKHVTLDQFDLSSNSPNVQTSDTQGIIAVNKVDSHLKIVQATLSIFSNPNPLDKETDEYLSFARYLLDRLPKNLSVLYDATDLDAIDNDTKRKIGKFIYNLFADRHMIDKYWRIFEDSSGTFFDESAHKEYLRWLEDEVAMSGLGTKDEEWLKSCLNSEDKSRALLSDVMTEIAELWLLSKEHHGGAVAWIMNFLSEAWKPTPAQVSGEPKEQIPKAESWCREKLGLQESDLQPIWYENLAKAYYRFDLYKDAIINYEKAAALVAPETASWSTMIGLADSSWFAASEIEKEKEAFSLKEKALEVYLGPKGSGVPIKDKVEDLLDLASWSEYLYGKEPEEKHRRMSEKHRKMAFDLAPDNPECQWSLLRHYLATRQTEKAQSALQTTLTGVPTKDGDSDAKPVSIAGLVKELVADIMYQYFSPTFWLVVSVATNLGVVDRLLEGFDQAIEEVRIKQANHWRTPTLHPMLVLHKGLVHLFNQKSDLAEIQTALEVFTEASAVAQEYQAAAKTPSEYFYVTMTSILGKYYFEQAHRIWRELRLLPPGEADAVPQQRRAILEFTQKLERVVAEYEQAVPNGEITGGKCFAASFSNLRGNQKGARDLFRSDMVQVINMLSDDEQSNDSWALGKLQTILLHSGYIDDAFVAYYLKSLPRIGDNVPGRMRSALEKILQTIEQRHDPPEEGKMSQLLSIFDEEKKGGTDVYEIVRKLVAETEKHIRPRKTGQDVPATTNTEGTDGSSAENSKPAGELNGEAVGDEPEEKAWIQAHKALKRIQDEYLFTWNDIEGRDCNNCRKYRDNGWTFEDDIYACKYCIDTYLCEPCLNEIKAGDPDKIHPVCHPLHDWMHLPKWTLDSWVESVMMVVRLPKKNEDGELVLGDETMDLPAWLDKVTEPWGGLAEDRMWDHSKSPPPPPKSEAGSEMPESGPTEGEEGEDKKENGAEEKTEETNGKAE
ncbi:hypothetical protein V8F20_007129 [Naviculisporaceae sp. PSN 640]